MQRNIRVKNLLKEGGFMSKIIVIDDSNLIRVRITEVLNKNGYINVESYESADLISKMPQVYLDNVSLIIIDIILPGISGIELIKTLKKYPKYNSIPIIFISSNSEKKTINEAIKAGAEDYLVKPFEDKVLLERVIKVLKDSQEDFNNRFIFDTERIKQIISIEHERAIRGNQPLSFIKLKINSEDMKICTIHLKNIIRKIDMVYILEQNILVILPLTNQKGAVTVFQKMNDRVIEFKVEILDKKIVTYTPDSLESEISIDEMFKSLL